MGFLETAKRVTDVRSFLQASANASSIKYTSEKGANHRIYIPFQTVEMVDEETGNKVPVRQPIAIFENVHDWKTNDGKYKTTICLKDKVREENGVKLNDGTCPICDRISDAWDIYNYRKDLEEERCQLTGEARKNYMEKTLTSFRDERKAKDPRSYMYLLIVKFRTDANGNAIMGANSLPEYELKVMKLSDSRVSKIQQQLINSGCDFVGCEITFGYSAVDDKRLQVSQSTTTPVFPANQFVTKYPALINAINEDVQKFKWDGIEKAFPEWAGMSTEVAKKYMDDSFQYWDEYQRAMLTNPSAKYLEYATSSPQANPDLSPAMAGGAMIPNIPSLPNIPGVGGVQGQQGMGMMQQGMMQPNIGQQNAGQPTVQEPNQLPNLGQNVQMPGAANGVFSGADLNMPNIPDIG